MSSSAPTRVSFPALWGAADTASASNQSRFFLLKRLELSGLVLGAGAALLPGALLGGVGPAISVLAFLAVICLQLSRAGAKAESRWYDARAAAESIKSAAWQYAAGGEAFRLDNADAEQRFLARLREILQNVPKLDLPPVNSASAGVTPSMATVRDLPIHDRAEVYRQQRVADQVRWYAAKSTWNRRRGSLFVVLTVVIEAVAVVCGVLRFKLEADLDLLGVLATVAAGLVAWSQAKKYEFLAESYSVTSHEVGLVAGTIGTSETEEEWAQLVHDAESAFSREHTMWQARRQGPTS